jgi:hypothetical protein
MSVQRWQVRDFRSRRRLLEPEDFAIGGSNPPPTDRVSPEVWRDLMSLLDDVAIRTTNEHGALIESLNKMRWSFLDVVEDSGDRFNQVLLDVQDEFGAALVFAIQGFYRQAATSLRTVLELATIGAYCNASSSWTEFDNWRSGQSELQFGRCVDRLPRERLVSSLETHLQSTTADTLFTQRTPTAPGGWSRRLYSTLSSYAHSRPTFANAAIWESNGPIYVGSAFLQFGRLLVETYSLTTLLVRIGRDGTELPGAMPAPWLRSRSEWARVVRAAHSFLR